MTFPDAVNFNVLERADAEDWNRVGNLAGKAVMDALLDAEAGTDSGSIAPRSRVLKGGEVVPGIGLQVSVTPTTLLLYDAAATGDASKYKMGRSAALQNVDLDVADITNPRFDLIYATPGTTASDAEDRLKKLLPSGQIVTEALNKSRRPTLTFAKVTGVASPTPVLPTLPAGGVALGYVLVVAGMTGVISRRCLDAREHYTVWPTSRAHGIAEGLVWDPASCSIGSGRAAVDGVPVAIATTTYAGRTVGWGANLEYHVYLIAPSPSTPLSRTRSHEVAMSTTAPGADGKPSAPIAYWPNNTDDGTVTLLTQRALYVSSHMTGADGAVLPGGMLPRSLAGDRRDHALDVVTGGLYGAPTLWFRPPVFQWVDAGGVLLAASRGLFLGQPFAWSGSYVGFASNLASGVSEAPSTWFYVYLRNRLARASVLRASASRNLIARISNAPPTDVGHITVPEDGFAADDYVYAGSIYNNESSDLLTFARDGWTTRYSVANLYEPDTPTFLWSADVTTPGTDEIRAAFVPNHVRFALVNYAARVTVDAGVAATSIVFRAGDAMQFQAPLAAGCAGNGDGAVNTLAGQLTLMLDYDRRFRFGRAGFAGASTDPAFTFILASAGFLESIF